MEMGEVLREKRKEAGYREIVEQYGGKGKIERENKT